MNVSSDEVKASLEALTNALEKQKRNFDKYDKILMRHGAKLESLETFDRSQYSCNKFILQKLSTNCCFELGTDEYLFMVLLNVTYNSNEVPVSTY